MRVGCADVGGAGDDGGGVDAGGAVSYVVDGEGVFVEGVADVAAVVFGVGAAVGLGHVRSKALNGSSRRKKHHIPRIEHRDYIHPEPHSQTTSD